MSATHRSGKHTISEVGESSSAARPVVRRRRGFLPVDEVWITEIQPLTIITFKSFLEQQILILFVAPNSNFISLSSQLKGVDRKSILCDFSKADQCAKGFEFKFSHDLNVQRRVTRLMSSVISVMEKTQWRNGVKRCWKRSSTQNEKSPTQTD